MMRFILITFFSSFYLASCGFFGGDSAPVKRGLLEITSCDQLKSSINEIIEAHAVGAPQPCPLDSSPVRDPAQSYARISHRFGNIIIREDPGFLTTDFIKLNEGGQSQVLRSLDRGFWLQVQDDLVLASKGMQHLIFRVTATSVDQIADFNLNMSLGFHSRKGSKIALSGSQYLAQSHCISEQRQPTRDFSASMQTKVLADLQSNCGNTYMLSDESWIRSLMTLDLTQSNPTPQVQMTFLGDGGLEFDLNEVGAYALVRERLDYQRPDPDLLHTVNLSIASPASTEIFYSYLIEKKNDRAEVIAKADIGESSHLKVVGDRIFTQNFTCEAEACGIPSIYPTPAVFHLSSWRFANDELTERVDWPQSIREIQYLDSEHKLALLLEGDTHRFVDMEHLSNSLPTERGHFSESNPIGFRVLNNSLLGISYLGSTTKLYSAPLIDLNDAQLLQFNFNPLYNALKLFDEASMTIVGLAQPDSQNNTHSLLIKRIVNQNLQQIGAVTIQDISIPYELIPLGTGYFLFRGEGLDQMAWQLY